MTVGPLSQVKEGEGSGKIIASSLDMDRKVEDRVVPQLSVDHDRNALRTFKLLRETKEEMADLVMIDFELNSLEIRKGKAGDMG